MKLERFWFFAALIVGLGYIAVLPPFQVNDEDAHWRRMWSVALFDAHCDRIPEVADWFPPMVHYDSSRRKGPSMLRSDFSRAWNHRGYNIPQPFISNACGYFPFAYVPSAIATRLTAFDLSSRPRYGGMLVGFYAGRLVNWLILSLAVWYAIRRLPWARYAILFFYSIPEVMQQAGAFGTDSYLLSVVLLLLALVFDPPKERAEGWLLVLISLLTITKPVFFPLVLFLIPLLLRRKQRGELTWRFAWLGLFVFVPIVLFQLWTMSLPPTGFSGVGIDWTNPAGQKEYMRTHVGHTLALLWYQVENLFGEDMLRGNWQSILGGFGWSAFKMRDLGYWLLLAAGGLSLVADGASRERFSSYREEGKTPGLSPWIWLLPIFSCVVAWAGIVWAMYIAFSAVGEHSANGVQGRYFLAPMLIAILSGIALVKTRLGTRLENLKLSHGAAIAACAMSLCGGVIGIYDVLHFFWR